MILTYLIDTFTNCIMFGVCAYPFRPFVKLAVDLITLVPYYVHLPRLLVNEIVRLACYSEVFDCQCYNDVFAISRVKFDFVLLFCAYRLPGNSNGHN